MRGRLKCGVSICSGRLTWRKNSFCISYWLSCMRKGKWLWCYCTPGLEYKLAHHVCSNHKGRGLFRSMAGYAVKQFDLVKNSTHRDKVLVASLNLARAKLFRGEHQCAVKMANYVSSYKCVFSLTHSPKELINVGKCWVKWGNVSTQSWCVADSWCRQYWLLKVFGCTGTLGYVNKLAFGLTGLCFRRIIAPGPRLCR